MSDITRDYSFGGWLRHFRIEKKITLRNAAKVLMMDAGNLSKLEQSKLSPPCHAQTIRAIAHALDLSNVQCDLLIGTAFSYHLGRLKKEFND